MSMADFREYSFTADQLPSFRTYRIKIILTSTSQVHVPRLRNLRVIALAWFKKMYKIEGNADLARDPQTNSIINVNTLEYEQYIKRREVKNESQQKVDNIETEVANIKNDVDEIKFLLKELLNKQK